MGKPTAGTNQRPRPDNPDRYTDPSRWVARVPAAMLTADLDGMEMRVQLALESHAQHDPCTIVANETLAEMTASPLRTIQHTLARLDAKGWIARVYEGGVEPRSRQKARRVGIILRRRLDPERPAAGTDEDVERVKDALLTRKMLRVKGGSTRKTRRVETQDVACERGPDTQDVASDLRSPGVKDLKLTGNDSFLPQGGDKTPPAEAPGSPQTHPEPEPAPMAVPSPTTPQPAPQAITADQLFEKLAGNPRLIGQAVAILEEETGDDRFGGCFRNACKAVAADPGQLPRLLHARDRGIKARKDGKGGPAFAQAFKDYIPVTGTKRASAPVYKVFRDDGLFAATDREVLRRKREAERAAAEAETAKAFAAMSPEERSRAEDVARSRGLGGMIRGVAAGMATRIPAVMV